MKQKIKVEVVVTVDGNEFRYVLLPSVSTKKNGKSGAPVHKLFQISLPFEENFFCQSTQ